MNKNLKSVKNLLEKKLTRQKSGRFVVEGPHLVEEAGDRIEYVVYSKLTSQVSRLIANGISCQKISVKEFQSLSGVETPQGTLAVVKKFDCQLGDILQNVGVIIYCLGIQDPGNLGTIIRSADAFGASGVILSKGTVDLYNPKTIRATMGSIFHLPIVVSTNDQETIGQLKKNNVKIITTQLTATKSSFDVNLICPVAILLGNEGSGLPPEIVKLADETVKIPMPGRAESLNAAISSAILLYEALKQRGNGK